MKINIGADELILWLRKNNKQEGIGNFPLGRKIAELMKKFGAEFKEENVKSLWSESEPALPNTSELYAIDVEKLPELFKKLAEGEF